MPLPAGYQIDAPVKGPPPGYKLDSTPAPERGGGVVSDFISNSPIGAVQGMAEAIRNPSATVKGALSENERLATEAKTAFGSGDYLTSARKGLNYLLNGIPGLGSAIDAASDDFAAGDNARGTAKTLGLASNMLVGKYGPGVMEKATSPKTPKPSKPVNVGGLMEMAKTGKDIAHVLASPNPITKLAAIGRLIEKYTSESVPIEPPAPPVVAAPPTPQPSATTVRPPLRGTPPLFSDSYTPTVPSARVMPEGPVRPPVKAPAPVPPTAAQGLDAFAKRAGFDGFASVPAEARPLIQNAYAAEAERMAQVQNPVAPVAPTVAPEAAVAPPRTVSPVAATAAKSPAELLRDEMLANGSITEAQLSVPEASAPVTPAGKVAIADMMRKAAPGEARAIADSNYAGNQDPAIASATYEAAGRATKSQALSQMLRDEGVSAAKASKWTPEQWAKAADERGFTAKHDPFSEASQKEVLRLLRKLEKTRKVTAGDLMQNEGKK